MKKYVADFIKRGLYAAAGGPIVLAIVYLILSGCGVVETLSATKIATEILTVTLMAFLASGVSVVYQIEKMSLLTATLVHFITLYIDYVLFYLMNGWLKGRAIDLMIFTLIYFGGYIVIWLIVYFAVKQNIKKLNRELK